MTAHPPAGDALVLGIDAGGTRTRAALARADAATGGSAMLATGTAGPGNAVSVPVDRLTEHLARAVEQVVTPERRSRVGAVVAGISGCSGGPDTNRPTTAAETALERALRRLGIAAGSVAVRSDAEVAFAGAPGAPADGLILIAGTGVVAARITDGLQRDVVDGDGWLLGDGGSGFWIGRRAVRKVLAALEDRGRPTLLTAAVTAHYLGEPVDARPADPYAGQELRDRLVRAVHARPSADLASVCPLVVAAAGHGDEVAGRLLAGAVKRLAATVATLDPGPREVLVTTGGLLGPDGVLLERLTRRLAPMGLRPVPVPDGLAGAVALARRALVRTE